MRHTAFILLILLTHFHANGQDQQIDLGAPYSILKASGNIHVRLRFSDQGKLTLLSGSDPAAIEWSNVEGTLTLKTGSEITQDKAVEVGLDYQQIHSIELNRGARMQSAMPLEAPFLELDVLNGSKAEIRVKLDSLNARATQGADIILYGSTGIQVVEAYTWGNYLAVDLDSREAEVSSATGAQVKLHVRERIKAKATSGGTVGYAGDPEMKDIKTSLGGEVNPLVP